MVEPGAKDDSRTGRIVFAGEDNNPLEQVREGLVLIVPAERLGGREARDDPSAEGLDVFHAGVNGEPASWRACLGDPPDLE
jgi:hypothetical protein